MSSIHQLLQNRTSCCKVSQTQPQPVALVTNSNHHCPDLDHPSHQTRVYQTAEAKGSLLLGAGKVPAQPTCLPRGLPTLLLTHSFRFGSNNFKTLKLKQRKEPACFWESCTGWCQAHDLHSEAVSNSHFLHWYWIRICHSKVHLSHLLSHSNLQQILWQKKPSQAFIQMHLLICIPQGVTHQVKNAL